MILTRRKTLLLLGAIPLASCATGSGTTTTPPAAPAFVAAFQALAVEIAQVIPQLAPLGLTGANATTAQSIVSDIESALSGVNSAMTQSQGASILVTVENYINDLAPIILAAIPAAALAAIPGGSIISIIIAALPEIELAVNFGASLLSSTAVQVGQVAPASTKLRGALSPLGVLKKRAGIK